MPAVWSVVSFDPPLQPRSYLQRRGRARAKGAEMVVMVPVGASDEESSRGVREMVEVFVKQEDEVSAFGAGGETGGREEGAQTITMKWSGRDICFENRPSVSQQRLSEECGTALLAGAGNVAEDQGLRRAASAGDV